MFSIHFNQIYKIMQMSITIHDDNISRGVINIDGFHFLTYM